MSPRLDVPARLAMVNGSISNKFSPASHTRRVAGHRPSHRPRRRQDSKFQIDALWTSHRREMTGWWRAGNPNYAGKFLRSANSGVYGKNGLSEHGREVDFTRTIINGCCWLRLSESYRSSLHNIPHIGTTRCGPRMRCRHWRNLR